MVNNNAPLLEMRNIQKDFFGNQVLTDINLTLREGEVLGLVGENGAGKSTLMKILFGMDVIRETGGYGGDVLIHGEKVSFSTPFDALKAGIGMVHQEFSLIPGFTATENILLNREPKKSNVVSEIFGDRLNTLDYKQMNERSAEAIKKMGVHIDQHMVISDMDVVIVGISENMESSILATLQAKEAGVPLVIAKCMSQMHANILKKVGADRVVMAESETGIRLGKSLISGGFQDFFMLSDSFSMVELPVPEAWTGHNLEELDLRKKYSINVIAVKDGEDIRVTVNPKTLLRAEEVLILIGENKELAKLMKNRK